MQALSTNEFLRLGGQLSPRGSQTCLSAKWTIVALGLHPSGYFQAEQVVCCETSHLNRNSHSLSKGLINPSLTFPSCLLKL